MASAKDEEASFKGELHPGCDVIGRKADPGCHFQTRSPGMNTLYPKERFIRMITKNP